MTKFNVGDRVVRISDTHIFEGFDYANRVCSRGSRGLVTDTYFADAPHVKWDEGNSSYIDNTNLVLESEYDKPKPKFKVGDRVIIKPSAGLKNGGRYDSTWTNRPGTLEANKDKNSAKFFLQIEDHLHPWTRVGVWDENDIEFAPKYKIGDRVQIKDSTTSYNEGWRNRPGVLVAHKKDYPEDNSIYDIKFDDEKHTWDRIYIDDLNILEDAPAKVEPVKEKKNYIVIKDKNGYTFSRYDMSNGYSVQIVTE